MSWNNSWKFSDINVTLGTMMGMGKLNKKKKKQNQNSSRIPKVIFEKLGKKKKKKKEKLTHQKNSKT